MTPQQLQLAGTESSGGRRGSILGWLERVREQVADLVSEARTAATRLDDCGSHAFADRLRTVARETEDALKADPAVRG